MYNRGFGTCLTTVKQFKTEYALLMSDTPSLPYAVVHSFFSIVGFAQKQFERIDIPYTVSLYIKT